MMEMLKWGVDYRLSVRRRRTFIAQYGFWRFGNLVVKISTEKARATCP
jgi:hypothetical protein